MTSTAGQKLGSLLVPLYLLAVLAGVVSGAVVGLVASLIALVQFVTEPEIWASWGARIICILSRTVRHPDRWSHRFGTCDRGNRRPLRASVE